MYLRKLLEDKMNQIKGYLICLHYYYYIIQLFKDVTARILLNRVKI